MSNRLLRNILLALAALAALAACKNGGGTQSPTIVSINLNPGTALAGSIIELSASISAPGQSVSSLVKDWEVTGGSISTTPPDFSLLLRQTAKVTSDTTVSTTNNMVYWIAPASSGPVTITVTVGQDSEMRTVQVGNSPVTLSVSDGVDQKKICSINANNVSDLYQAAFRVNFGSAWHVDSVVRESFLGGANETLFIGLDDKNGFVPVAITRKGNVAGVDGSGSLATITFAKNQTTSAADPAANRPFELEMVVLRSSSDQPIEISE